jgi:hypothetical protein
MDETGAGSNMGEDRESEVAAEMRDVAEEPVAPGSADAPEQVSDAPEPLGEAEGGQAPEPSGNDAAEEPAEADEVPAEEPADADGAPVEGDAQAALWADDAQAEMGEAPADDSEKVAPEAAPGTTPTLDELVAELAEPEPAAGSVDESEILEAAGEGSASGERPEDSEGGEPAEGGAVEGTAPAESGADGGAEPEAIEEPELPVVRRMSTRVPFWVLGAAWVAFAGGLTYLLWPTSTGVFVTSPIYGYFVFGGAALVIIGLVLGLIVWLAARSSVEKGARAGIAGVVWMRALGWTAIGVVLWWIALTVLDLHRTGVIH